MRRHLRVEAALHVALVLQAQRVGIVLGVPKDKEAAAVGRLDDVQAHLVGHGHDLKLRLGLHVLAAHIGVARMHGIETVVEAADQRALRLHQIMLEHAARLCRQVVLLDTVMMVQAGLRAPTNVQRRVHVRGGPIHDLAELGPVVDLLERHLLHRRARDDQAVVMDVADVVECAVERLQVAGAYVRGLVRFGAQQVHLHLQRRVGELAHDLRLGGNLGGHEVEDEHAQRTDVLVQRAVLGHDKDVLALELRSGREGVGNTNGHGCSLRVSCSYGTTTDPIRASASPRDTTSGPKQPKVEIKACPKNLQRFSLAK